MRLRSCTRGGAEAVARARALVGIRFRPQGRQPEHGLDCLGLVAKAAGIPEEEVPRGYRLRSQVPEEAIRSTFGNRVRPIEPQQAGVGDVALARAGAGQHHLLILTGDGFIHADARHGRVVETPGSPEWPLIAAWQVVEQVVEQS
jgi:cell wall-associated NlpC family hydrolase